MSEYTRLTEKFSSDEIFEKHPSTIPYFSDEYFKQDPKILVLGESHYVDGISANLVNTRSGRTEYVDAWYSLNDEDFVKKYDILHGSGWFTTKDVMKDLLDCCKESVSKNPEQCKKIMYIVPKILANIETNTDLTESLSWEEIANFIPKISYANFYSRPHHTVGGSIQARKHDNEAASERLDKIVEFLEPKLIFVLSKKVSNQISNSLCLKFNRPKIIKLYHPAAWSKFGGNNGHSCQTIRREIEIAKQNFI